MSALTSGGRGTSGGFISNKAAVAQLTSTSNKLSNLLKIAHCAALAKQQGASMLFLPECFGFIGSSAAETLENAEVITETEIVPSAQPAANRKNDPAVTQLLVDKVNQMPTSIEQDKRQVFFYSHDNKSISLMDGLRTIAQASNLWISGGGIHEYIPEESRVYNTHVILNNNGDVICKYRKVHLFDVSIPDRGINLQESNTTRPGETLVVTCESPLGILGLTTCYDLRFPEQYTALVQHGAQILLTPSAFTIPTGQAHWHVLLRARAIETQCYVLAAAQVGQHNEKRESYGHALIVSPWGDILADAGSDPNDTPQIIVGAMDLNHLNDIRLRMPIQAHRRGAALNAV